MNRRMTTLLPPGVSPYEDRGVYMVASRSRAGFTHRVDVEALACDCESSLRGASCRARKRDGITWASICPHLRLSLAAHGALHALREAKNHRTEGP